MNNSLTLEMATAIAKGAMDKAVELQLNLVICIVDNHGNTKLFHRMDNTSYGSIRISELKAKTAASMPVSSKQLAERSAGMPANPYSAIPDILLLGGGLPIFSESNVHIGAIGISGATPELDEECAAAGVKALKA